MAETICSHWQNSSKFKNFKLNQPWKKIRVWIFSTQFNHFSHFIKSLFHKSLKSQKIVRLSGLRGNCWIPKNLKLKSNKQFQNKPKKKLWFKFIVRICPGFCSSQIGLTWHNKMFLQLSWQILPLSFHRLKIYYLNEANTSTKQTEHKPKDLK